jgi:Glycosyltransferase Family 4/Glycosyl transferases group 1
MKRLLAVSWEMPPMYGPRATQVSRLLGALTPLGWRSTVVCMDPRRGGPHWRDGVDAVLPEGVDTLRVASPEEQTLVRAARRLFPSLRNSPDPQSVWIEPASSSALARARSTRPAGLVSFAQPWSDHLVGLRVHRATKLPWVAHFSDPWIDSAYLRATKGNLDAAAAFEADIIREATGVVFVTDETADLVMKKYPREWREKVAVIPHGFDPAASSKAPAPSRRPGPLRIVYAGRFYEGIRTPTMLLRALAQLKTWMALENALEITIVGPHVVPFSRESSALGLDGVVRWRDRVSPADALTLSTDADVLLVIDAPSHGPSPFLPSKLVDYLPLQKPILGITPREGATARLLAQLGCPVAAPDDAKDIERAIGDLLQRHRDGSLDVGPRFAEVAGEFDVRRVAASFNSVLTRAFDVARAESA